MLQPSYTIVLTVMVKVGVEATDSRNAESSSGSNRRPFQRPLRRHIHYGRLGMSPGSPQQTSRGHPELQSVVTRQRQTTNQDRFSLTIASGAVGRSLPRLFWMHDRY